MKITKIGHCCLLIEEHGLRIMTDPGVFSTKQNDLKDIDVVLITHEHADHLHVDSLKSVLKNNPQATVFTNKGVAKILDKEGISYQLLGEGEKTVVGGILIEGFGHEHAYIYKTIPEVENTGYFIAEKLFYPGDALFNPKKEIAILALPVAGPWLKISEAIDYAITLKPKYCFPVHDGMMQKDRVGVFHRAPEGALTKEGIKFISMKEGDDQEFK